MTDFHEKITTQAIINRTTIVCKNLTLDKTDQLTMPIRTEIDLDVSADYGFNHYILLVVNNFNQSCLSSISWAIFNLNRIWKRVVTFRVDDVFTFISPNLTIPHKGYLLTRTLSFAIIITK